MIMILDYVLSILLSHGVAADKLSEDYVLQVYCLSKNIYHEAANQSDDGRAAVGFVTLTRYNDRNFPDTICDVVFERKQFSWTLEPLKVSNDKPLMNNRDYKEIVLLSHDLMSDTQHKFDPSYGADHYHKVEMPGDGKYPAWTGDKNMRKLVIIGDHIFYTRYKWRYEQYVSLMKEEAELSVAKND